MATCQVGVVRGPLASLWAAQKSTVVGRFEMVVDHDQLGGVAMVLRRDQWVLPDDQTVVMVAVGSAPSLSQ